MSAVRPGALSFGISQLLHLHHHLYTVSLHSNPSRAPPVAKQCPITLNPAMPPQRNPNYSLNPLCVRRAKKILDSHRDFRRWAGSTTHLEVEDSISLFSCCCDEISWKEQLNEERVYYGSLFKGTVYHAMEGDGGGKRGAQPTFSFLGFGPLTSVNGV